MTVRELIDRLEVMPKEYQVLAITQEQLPIYVIREVFIPSDDDQYVQLEIAEPGNKGIVTLD